MSASHVDSGARSRAETDPQLSGNILAEICPLPPATDEAAFEMLRRRPQVRPAGFLDQSLALREEWLDRLDRFHYVFPIEIAFLRSVISLMRKSFIPRDLRNPRVMEALLEAADGKFMRLERLVSVGGCKLAMLLLGPTGSGKTSLVDRIVDLIGQVARTHCRLNEKTVSWQQLPAIRVHCGVTLKETLKALIEVIDAILRSRYQWIRSKDRTRPGYLEAVMRASSCHFCPLIILDDVHCLREADREAGLILETLCMIIEGVGIPILAVGTPPFEALIQENAMHLGKLSSHDRFKFSPMRRDEARAGYLSALKEQHVSKSSPKYSDDFDRHLHSLDMGIVRVECDYMKYALKRHAHNESTILNKSVLDDICVNEMAIYEPSMRVLRAHQLGIPLPVDVYRRYEDLLPRERVRTDMKSKEELQKLATVRGETINSLHRIISAEEYERQLSKESSASAKPGATPKKISDTPA